MRQVVVLLSVIIIMVFSSCNNHSNPGTLALKFKPTFAGADVHLNTTYGPVNGIYYKFTNMRFYLSHIRLVRSDQTTVEVSPLAYVSLNDDADMSIPLADSLGSFVGIQFNIGVDSIQDNVNPGTIADTSNPQCPNNNMFWDFTRKFVFVVLEGAADQHTTPQNGILYHVGMSPYYTPVQLNYSFSVTGGKQTTLALNSTIDQMFYSTSGSYINVLSDPYTEVQTGMDANNIPYTTLGHAFITDFSQTFSLTAQ